MTALDEFLKYTESYKKYGDKIDLKINHTVRVKDLCIDIAKSIGLDNEDIELASICGLLHDIGRFEQWKDYQTFSDIKTIDHGDLGVEILTKDNFISNFSSNNHNTILKTVKYHNKYRVPNTLNDKNILFTNIVRDADKIDILYLFVNGGLVNKTNNTVMSKSIMKNLFDKKLIKKGAVKTKADEIAVRLAFVFDLNFKRSFEIIKDNNYMNKMIDVQIEETNNKELIKQLEELRKYINNYIGEKIKC